MKKVFLVLTILVLFLSFSFQARAQIEGLTLDLDESQANQTELESLGDGVWQLTTTGNNSWIMTKVLKQERASDATILSFEYFCPQGLDRMRLFFGPEIDTDNSKVIGSLSLSEGWVGFTIDLSREIKDWGKKGECLRIDLGSKPDVILRIRKLMIRTQTERERKVADESAAKKIQEARQDANMKTYLSGTYPSGIDQVKVNNEKVLISGHSTSTGDVYLCEVPPYMDVTEMQDFETSIPVSDPSFELSLDRYIDRNGFHYDRLLSKWVLAKKTNGKYKLVSHARYPDEILAKYDLPNEKPASKKGLGGFYVGKGPISDLDDLGITSATVNIRFTGFMYTTPAEDRMAHHYNGKTYYFGKKELEKLDATLQETAKRNIVVAAILLVNKAEQCPDPEIGRLMLHPDMDPAGKYSMPNMTNPESVNCYAAALDFLAARYSRPDKKYGRVHHWIMHNEVNMGWVWTNMGVKSEMIFMDAYVKSMRMCYNIARSYNPHSEVMISVTKQWLWKSSEKFYLVKDLMDILLDYSRAEGDFQWGLAIHPYPESLFEPKVWLDQKVQYDFNSPIRTFKNLEVLNAWIKLPEILYQGKTKRSLWLSENGTNSKTYSEQDLLEQAAGFALTWKKLEPLDGIDGLQWHGWNDSRGEGGLRLGLRRFPDDETDPLGEKPVWYAYQAAGTEKENVVFDPYKKMIGIDNWNQLNYIGEIDQNKKRASFRDIQSDTWVATDALGRKLPGYEECGPVKEDRYIGMFYFVTHVNPGKDGPYDVSKIKKENPENPKWGVGSHYWGEPEIGYYLNYDEWAIRRHANQLNDAGVDVIIFDVTNNKTFPEVYLPICKIWRKMRQEGERTPDIAFLGSEISVNTLWKDFYQKGMYPDLWFYWKGKPLLLYGQHEMPERNKVNDIVFSDDILNFFSLRQSWAWTSLPWYQSCPYGKDKWPWVDHYPQAVGWHDSPEEKEMVPVAVGQHPLSNIGRSFHQFHQPETDKYDLTPFTGEGLHFQEQWNHALEVDPEFVFITGWNEWTVGRSVMGKDIDARLQNYDFYPGAHLGMVGREIKPGDTFFLDQYNQEYSRDIEPMKGGHTDNYYYQLINNVRKYRGVQKGPEAGAMKFIDLSKGFEQWEDVKAIYYDHIGDVAKRNSLGEGKAGPYLNNTGRNDIVESRVARDADNIYFYVKTKDNLTAHTDANWMLLYIDADQDKSTGWEGYDYLINSKIVSSQKTTIKTWKKNKWRNSVEVSYTYSGNEMMIAIPRQLMNEQQVTLDFHWADNIQKLDDINEFFLNGDNAPDRRFNYRFTEQNEKSY